MLNLYFIVVDIVDPIKYGRFYILLGMALCGSDVVFCSLLHKLCFIVCGDERAMQFSLKTCISNH